jgi:U5 small nuclear ribonucleoprotein component
VKLIFQRYLSVCSPLVDAITNHIQSPAEQTKRIIDAHYTGSQTADSFYDQIIKCSRDGPLYIHTVKMFNKVDCKSFDVFGRVLSGTIREGQ